MELQTLAPTGVEIAEAGTTRRLSVAIENGERKVSQSTNHYAIAQHGQGPNRAQLTSPHKRKCDTIYNKGTLGSETTRGRMTEADVYDVIQATLILVQRTVTAPATLKTSCQYCQALSAGQVRRVYKCAAAARRQQ